MYGLSSVNIYHDQQYAPCLKPVIHYVHVILCGTSVSVLLDLYIQRINEVLIHNDFMVDSLSWLGDEQVAIQCHRLYCCLAYFQIYSKVFMIYCRKLYLNSYQSNYSAVVNHVSKFRLVHFILYSTVASLTLLTHLLRLI